MRNFKNSVTLIGHVGADPKIVNFENGNSIANIVLATNETYKNKSGEKIEKTQWHNLVVRNGLVKIVESYVKKGKEIGIEGKLTNRSYEDKDGRTVYVTEIQVNDLVLFGGKK